ncbi:MULTISPECIES: Chromate resistance protein ChrB [unclassified Streptomyces]|uniref:Chromate resistance protein ChrB n=1 Tax=unclassified Streptomyces TaxID=2593676 RepID=UPI00278C00FA|nr:MULTISPECIES: Chromate resistance protein ChrB [unclassified Streptomyces]
MAKETAAEAVAGLDRFLLITTSTAGAPEATRVRVWRKLRSLGALYLQNSVCLLPDLPVVRRQVQRLLVSVRKDGGTGRTLTVVLGEEGELAEVVGEFNAARDQEYGEVVERAPQLLAELERETARGRATYAEVEESEADLERFDKWLTKIAARDYFAAPGGAAAREAVERCRAALADFEDAALAAETAGPAAPAASAAAAGSDAVRRPRPRPVD